MSVKPEFEAAAGGVSLIMSAAAGLLLQFGYEREEIRSWLDLAFEGHDRALSDPRMAEAIGLLGEFGADVQRDIPDGYLDDGERG